MVIRTFVSATTIVAILAGVVALASESPWILYPSTPSLPPGFYVRTLDDVVVGSIAAFDAPEAAIRYKLAIGERVEPGFLFMKPVIAGPGDQVCNRRQGSLELNGKLVADVITKDRFGRPLPVWQGCEVLSPDRYFTLSDFVPNSFDSRHYGPIDAVDILGVYRPLMTFGPARSDRSPSDLDLPRADEEIGE